MTYKRLAVLICLVSAACKDDDHDKGTPVIIEAFSATPDGLTATADVTLSWTVTGATSLRIEPDVGEVTGDSLSLTVYAPTTFTLTATNARNSAAAVATVTMTLAPFVASVDPSLVPRVDQLTPQQPVAATADDKGVQSDFVVDEVRIRPRSQGELESFIARHGGQVLYSDAVPEPPASLQRDVPAVFAAAQEYVVHFDSTGTSTGSLPQDAHAMGIGGSMRFSSARALEFFAAVAREAAAGLRIAPNYVAYGDAVLFSTRERPNGSGGFANALDPTQFPRFQQGGSRASVAQAWQWIRAHGVTRQVIVAVIDGGFWLDGAGNAVVPPGDVVDFANGFAQYDFVNNDYNAGGPNPGSCGAGNPCPWHGHGSASVAVGLVDNQGGAAGTGGLVATPMMFMFNSTFAQARRAVRTAAAWGADVINMSFGGACNLGCRQAERKDNAYADAAGSGLVLVASAGNSSITVGEDNFVHPCINDGVICVGALNNEANTRINYSNFGPGLDIWAPTNIPSAPDQATPNALTVHTGTSASSPFVAGIAAMLKAIDPSLTSEGVRVILQETAWTDSADSNVSHVVNALAAVQRASQQRLPNDRLEPNESAGDADPLAAGANDDFTIATPSDVDVHRFVVPSLAVMQIDLLYPTGIGALRIRDYGLNGVVGCGYAEQTSDNGLANGRRLLFRAPPGTYTLALGSPTALPYDVSLTVNTGGPFTIPTDSFEPNDDFANRRSVGDGSLIKGTLHTAGDVDFYSFYSSGNYSNSVLTLVTEAEIRDADGPLTLRLYNNSGTLIGESSSTADCGTFARLVVPLGTHAVSVSGASAGAYTLWLGATGTQHPLVDIGKIFHLIFNPNEPIEYVMHGPRDWILATNLSDYELDAVELYTPGVHLRLYSVEGTLLGEGVAEDYQGTIGERAPTGFSSANGSFMIEMTRILEDGVATETMAPVRVQLNLQRAL